MRFVLENIHTILVVLGMAAIVLAAFLFDTVIGFLVLGVCLIITGILIDRAKMINRREGW